MAYYQLEPFGQARGDLQAGIVASAVYNVYRDPAKKSEPFQPQDFVLDFGEPVEDAMREQDPSAIYKQFRAWAKSTGAK